MRTHRTWQLAAIASVWLLAPPSAWSQASDIIETVETGCKQDIERHCKDVTPGESRVLACLYAYQDKISSRCEYALYDASARLERAVAALSYVSSECSADLESYCATVMPGGGRILECMRKNQDKLSARCKLAMEDTREEVEAAAGSGTKPVSAGQEPSRSSGTKSEAPAKPAEPGSK